MMIGMALFWGVVIFGLVWFVRDAGEHRPRPKEPSPLELLDRRFAEGSISADEYRERRAVLTATEGAA